jgi:hypothetical protein
MFEFCIVFVSMLLWLKYTRKSLKDKASQTEMVSIDKGIQTECDDAMSCSSFEFDSDFFRRDDDSA